MNMYIVELFSKRKSFNKFINKTMSFILNKEKAFYISSSIDNPTVYPDSSQSGPDGTFLSADKSTLRLTYDSPGITIPTSAINASFEVSEASIWNSSSNISVLLANNTFTYIIGGVVQPIITIVDGLYSDRTLNNFISREFVNRGQSSTLIVFTGDSSTQKMIATFEATVQADFTPITSIASIMGFNPAIIPNPAEITDGFSVYGDVIASFNTVNNFTIKTDLISEGIPINNTGVNLLAVVPIPAGSINKQVNYQPQNPTRVDANELRGKTKQSFFISISDQDGDNLAQQEDWSVLIILRYTILITDQSVPKMDF